MNKSSAKKCPCCNKISVWEGNHFRPFCSERCRTIDLGNWAMEKYRVPVTSPTTGEFFEESENQENAEKERK